MPCARDLCRRPRVMINLLALYDASMRLIIDNNLHTSSGLMGWLGRGAMMCRSLGQTLFGGKVCLLGGSALLPATTAAAASALYIFEYLVCRVRYPLEPSDSAKYIC